MIKKERYRHCFVYIFVDVCVCVSPCSVFHFCRLVRYYLLSLIHLYSFRMVPFLNARLSFVIDNETDKIHPWTVFQLKLARIHEDGSWGATKWTNVGCANYDGGRWRNVLAFKLKGAKSEMITKCSVWRWWHSVLR